MINNIPIETAICNNPTDYENAIAPNFESNLQLTKIFEELSIRMISEYHQTIAYSGVQVTNTIRSLKYFYPGLNDEVISKISTFTKEIIKIINSFNKKLTSLLDSNHSKDEKKQEILSSEDLNTFQVNKSILMEKYGVNKFRNNLKFYYIRTNITVLGESARREIGLLALRFQEQNFINQTKKEQYYG
jgi:hypothetical protein